MSEHIRQTPHHEWDIPVEGRTRNWDEVLNNFFENQLDTDVILVGSANERPEAGEDAPVLFFDNGARKFDYNDGTQWIDGVISSGAVAAQDDDVEVASSVTTVNFGSSLSVADDGGGKVTVNATGEASGGHNVEDSGEIIVDDVASVNFATDLSVTDDGANEVTVASTASDSPAANLASGTITLDSTNPTVAYDATLPAALTEEDTFVVTVTPVSSTTPSDDYAFNYDWSRSWDDSAQEVNVDLTVNWDTVPVSDFDATWVIKEL